MSAKFLKNHALKFVVLLVIVAVIGGCGGQRFKEKTPAPDFSLTRIDGEEISLANTNGKARLLYFFFSNCPDVCPPTTHKMSLVQERLKELGAPYGDKIALLSITFDPERDTVERLTEFSSWYGADYDGWYFLRGEEQEVRDVALSYGISTIPLEDGSIGHQNLYILIDKEGNIRNYYMVGMEVEEIDTDQIADDLMYLAKE